MKGSKGAYGVLTFFAVWALLAIVLSGDKGPVEFDPWVEKSEEVKLSRKYTPPFNYGREYPWERDEKHNTLRWRDFNEEIEDKGIMLDEPDAIDLWEKNYE